MVARLRAAIPGITFSTDIIVGFPGETEAQFEETLSLVAEAGFDDAYTFKYSVREGTPAVRLPGPRGRRGRGRATGAAHRAWSATRRGARTWRGSGQYSGGAGRTSRPARGPAARPYPHQPAGAGGAAHRRRSASITRSNSPEPLVRPSPAGGASSSGGARMTKHAIRNAVEDQATDAYGPPGRPFPGFLWLRDLPARCAGLRPQPIAATLCDRTRGVGGNGCEPRQGPESRRRSRLRSWRDPEGESRAAVLQTRPPK